MPRKTRFVRLQPAQCHLQWPHRTLRTRSESGDSSLCMVSRTGSGSCAILNPTPRCLVSRGTVIAHHSIPYNHSSHHDDSFDRFDQKPSSPTPLHLAVCFAQHGWTNRNFAAPSKRGLMLSIDRRIASPVKSKGLTKVATSGIWNAHQPRQGHDFILNPNNVASSDKIHPLSRLWPKVEQYTVRNDQFLPAAMVQRISLSLGQPRRS